MKTITQCRSCRSMALESVLDLGTQYLSDFRSDESKPPAAPLDLVRCSSCTLVQLRHTVDRNLLYGENYGFKSSVNPSIRNDLNEIVRQGLNWAPHARSWLDIACNDGTLLSYVPPWIWRVGVDPVRKFRQESTRHANKIVSDYFSSALFHTDEKFDVVTSISMFYDIDQLSAFVAGVNYLLKPQGIWIIQQNYLLPMVQQGAVDNVCHEHLSYFSLHSLRRLLHYHNLDLLDVETSNINGGVIRTIVGPAYPKLKKAANHDRINEQLDLEISYGINEPGVFAQFRERVDKNLDDLHSLVNEIKDSGKSIYYYGASTRGAVLWQGANISHQVDYAVERQPEKIGKWYSPMGVEIISEERMRRDHPDYLLVGPWWHREQFIEREAEYLKKGGKMIFPLPNVEVVEL
jgi:NDP-4-keto-2,6-dideoxyhexose 3-C-methyltransferase